MSASPKERVILLAEDDPDDQLLTKDAIGECQLSVDLRLVENGEDLLDYLHQRGQYQKGGCPRPQLILLDLNMPRKDGREALREIRSDPSLRSIPVVVLTTSRSDSDIDRMYELGANSFIAKPVNFEELVKVLQNVGKYWFETVELPLK